MDYGRPFEGATDDVILAALFLDAGLPVARVLAAHPDAGCLLLEDLGADTLEDVLARLDPGSADDARRAVDLYRSAARLAAAVAVKGTPVLAASERAAGPALDAERFRFEMGFFATHFLGDLLGLGEAPGELAEALSGLADRAANGPRRVLCHRDFHSRNLMVLPDGALAMVDIQDARWGPDTYDLASLLFDAYFDVPEDGFRGGVEEFLASAGLGAAPPAFEERFSVVAAERMIKALGTFGYQVGVLGKERYRAGIPRTAARLRRLLPSIPGGGAIHFHFERLGVYRLAGG
jgi:aminoglycoside/choline kinase family phosphotransferase